MGFEWWVVTGSWRGRATARARYGIIRGMNAFTTRIIAIAACVAASSAANAAAKVRLVYGRDWDRAGQAVKATMSSSAFKTAARGRYVAEFVDEAGSPDSMNLGSLKLPAIFVIDSKDRCFFVFENVPKTVTAEYLVKKIAAVDRKREEIEAKGTDTADRCGELLQSMERFVGGPSRVIKAGFYADVFEKLKKLDPGDESGWQRHFTMGDGIDIVAKATEFRENGDIQGGAKFIEAEKKKPRRRLTREQQQALLMAQFALYRDDQSKRAENIKFLSRIAEAGEGTFWGTAALGWMNILGAPPLSVYWGWHRGDFAPPRFAATVRYGVANAFAQPGDYTIAFEPEGGGSVNVESVTLKAGDEEVATLKKPPFAFKVTRELAGRIGSMTVRGTTGTDGAGAIRVVRQVLRPRKTVK